MAEDIKNLIEQIQKEGFGQAQEKARKIEEEAKAEAKKIVANARLDAARIVSEAEEETQRLKESTNTSLKHAARDMLINLRKEINSLLQKLVLSDIQAALTPEELVKIITMLIKEYGGRHKEDIIVALKKADLEKLEKSFLSQLKDVAKKGITLKPSEEIGAGFIISFDAGRSHFDFTDKALAEYIGAHVETKLGALLEEIAA